MHLSPQKKRNRLNTVLITLLCIPCPKIPVIVEWLFATPQDNQWEKKYLLTKAKATKKKKEKKKYKIKQ